MTKKKQVFGKFGEELAEKYLISAGYDIVAKNVRLTYGEIDIIAKLLDEWVFVEVKSRKSIKYGSAAESLTPRKIINFSRAVIEYLYKNNLYNVQVSADLIAITMCNNKDPFIEHLIGAIPLDITGL